MLGRRVDYLPPGVNLQCVPVALARFPSESQSNSVLAITLACSGAHIIIPASVVSMLKAAAEASCGLWKSLAWIRKYIFGGCVLQMI